MIQLTMCGSKTLPLSAIGPETTDIGRGRNTANGIDMAYLKSSNLLSRQVTECSYDADCFAKYFSAYSNDITHLRFYCTVDVYLRDGDVNSIPCVSVLLLEQ